MLEVARYEARRRLRGTIVAAVGMAAFALLMVAIFPSVEASGVDFEQLLAAYPPAVVEAFGIRALGTVEGFLAAEFYNFVWTLLLGVYTAYAAGGAIAGKVADGRIELELSAPVSRARYVGETYLALVVPLLVYNVVVALAVVAGVLAIGEWIPLWTVAAVHLLSVPYLLATTAIGLAVSTALDRAAVAERVALALVFGLFLVESVTASTDVSVLGKASPTHYYDATAILVDGSHDLLGAAILLGIAGVAVLVAALVFSRRDL